MDIRYSIALSLLSSSTHFLIQIIIIISLLDTDKRAQASAATEREIGQLRQENTELKTRLMNAMESMEQLAREVADLKQIKTAAMDLVSRIDPILTSLSSDVLTYVLYHRICVLLLLPLSSSQLATERIRNKEMEEELEECRHELSESYRATVILK